LQQAKDCSSSIIGLPNEGRSILSEGTNTNSVSLEFDFDAMILGSRAYRSAHRSNLKQVIFSKAKPSQSSSSSVLDDQRAPLSSLVNSQRKPSAFPHDPDRCDANVPDETPAMEIFQSDAPQSQASIVGNIQMDDGLPQQPNKTASNLALQNVTVPAPTRTSAESKGSEFDELPVTTNEASPVAGHGLIVPSKVARAPGSTLLRSLRKA
jgi:hypothetical protein